MKRDELSGAGKLDANQPHNLLIALLDGEQRTPPDATVQDPADLRGAGDDFAAEEARRR